MTRNEAVLVALNYLFDKDSVTMVVQKQAREILATKEGKRLMRKIQNNQEWLKTMVEFQTSTGKMVFLEGDITVQEMAQMGFTLNLSTHKEHKNTSPGGISRKS